MQPKLIFSKNKINKTLARIIKKYKIQTSVSGIFAVPSVAKGPLLSYWPSPPESQYCGGGAQREPRVEEED